MTSPLFPISLPDISTPCAYAGLGARKTPQDVLDLMVRIGYALALLGHTLRSGAATGADTAFEQGHRAAVGAERLEIYLPWAAFEREARAAQGWTGGIALQKATMQAEAIASKVHPRWAYLGDGARLLQSRNVHQVLGRDLDDPVRFVLCWTPDGATSWRETSQKTGGTGQAIRLASRWDASVHNLQRPDHRRAWEEWLATSPTT